MSTADEGILPQVPVAPGASDSQSVSQSPLAGDKGTLSSASTTLPTPSSFTPALPDGTATVSPAMQVSPEVSVSQHPRIFLDICSGSTRPLSKALLAMHKTVLSIDILLCSEMDLLDDAFYLITTFAIVCKWRGGLYSLFTQLCGVQQAKTKTRRSSSFEFARTFSWTAWTFS